MFNADSQFLRCTLAVVATLAAAGCGGSVIDEDYDVDQQGLHVRKACAVFKTEPICSAHAKRCVWMPDPIPLGAPGGLGINDSYKPPVTTGGSCIERENNLGKDGGGGTVTSDGGVICAIGSNGGIGGCGGSADAGSATTDAGTVTGKGDAGTAVCSKGSVLVYQVGGPALQYPPPGPHCSAVNAACTAVSACSCLSASEGRCSPHSKVAGACSCDNGIR